MPLCSRRAWPSSVSICNLSPHASLFSSERNGRAAWSCTTVACCCLAAWELLFISAVMQMGLALPHGALLSSRHHHRIALKPTRRALGATHAAAADAALASGYISPWLAKLPMLLTAFAVDGITGTVRGLGALRISDLRVPMPSMLMVLAAAALVLAMWSARRRPLLTWTGRTAILAASLALAFISAPTHTRPGVLKVTSIDVCEGDSTLLVTPHGRTLLVDAGGPGSSQLDFGEDVVSPYLWIRRISRLDAVAITRVHSDHIGCTIAVLKNFKPKELWVGLLPPSQALENVITTAQALGASLGGVELTLGGTKLQVLFPPSDWFVGSKPVNNDSMVLRVTYGDSSLLLEETRRSRWNAASRRSIIPLRTW